MTTADASAKIELSTAELLDRSQAEMRDFIVRAMRTRAVSLSSLDATRTGNRYQSVRLGERAEPGFRRGDRDVFAGLQVRNRTVADLGCNFGEICRDAIRAGAARATGFEYDAFFIQMGRYITAFNGLNGVDFVEADLTEAAAYTGQFDIVLVLSAFRYVKHHLDRLAEMTRRVLVLETHSVDADWQDEYLKPLQQRFAFVALVGLSDHKAKSRAEVRYLLLASQKPLDGAMAKRAREVGAAAIPFRVDTGRSVVRHYDQFLARVGVPKGTDLPELLAATRRAWPRLTADEVAADIAETRNIVVTPSYWAAFLLGYVEARDGGAFRQDNIYFEVFAKVIAAGHYAGALVKLMEQPEEARARLALRFEMIDRWQRGEASGIGDPVILYSIVNHPSWTEASPWRLHVSPAEETVTPLALDGHHRLFLAYATGAEAVPFLPMWSDTLAPVRAALRRDKALAGALWSSVFPLARKLWQ